MTPLPYGVPQYTPEQRARAVKAHVTRGLSRWLSNLETPNTHPLDLLYLCNLHTQINQQYSVRITAGTASHIVRQFTTDVAPWDAPGRMSTLLWALSLLQRYSVDQQDFEAVLAKAYYYHHCVYSRNRETRMFDMKEDDASKLPADVYSRLNSVLADLEATLLAKDAMMPQHLRNIHSLIISYPESTHLLKDEEIALIIGAAQEHTKVQIVSDAAKKATAPRAKSLKNVSVGDL